MKTIPFYALRSDITPVLNRLQGKCAVRFVDMNDNKNPNPKEWTNANDIPGLGKATHETGQAGDRYLILKSVTPITFSRSTQNNTAKRFDIYQVTNPESIIVVPAGEWNRNVILAGEFTTMSSTPISRILMQSAYAGIRNSFKKIGNYYWVGPEALSRLESGARLTPAEQSPPEFDLRRTAIGDQLIQAKPPRNDAETAKVSTYSVTSMEEIRKIFGKAREDKQ